jgi:hypothetical protein
MHYVGMGASLIPNPCCVHMRVKSTIILRKFYLNVSAYRYIESRSLWLPGLRRGSAAAFLLGLWFRIPTGAWMSECWVLSGRGLCDGLITRPGGTYQVWCV